MKLFLASEAKHPDSVKKFEEFLGGFKDKKFAYIPTAANGEIYGSWKEGNSWNLFSKLVPNLKTIQLEEYGSPAVLEELKDIDVLYFAGGYAGYLMYWIIRCELDIHIPKMLEEGVIYAGSSAGGMITGPDMNVAEWYLGEEERGSSNIQALNLVDFHFYPHFEDEQLDEIKSLYKGKKMYLVKNGEEIIVDGDKVTVQGEERIIEN